MSFARPTVRKSAPVGLSGVQIYLELAESVQSLLCVAQGLQELKISFSLQQRTVYTTVLHRHPHQLSSSLFQVKQGMPVTVNGITAPTSMVTSAF
jgi:hypothetical protein